MPETHYDPETNTLYLFGEGAMYYRAVNLVVEVPQQALKVAEACWDCPAFFRTTSHGVEEWYSRPVEDFRRVDAVYHVLKVVDGTSLTNAKAAVDYILAIKLSKEKERGEGSCQ